MVYRNKQIRLQTIKKRNHKVKQASPWLVLGIIHLKNYSTPGNLSNIWNFGSLAGFAFFIQMVSGLLLATHYTPSIDSAFISVEHIMRDVNYGWLLRYTHSCGASVFFGITYAHILRGIYFKQYKRKTLWISGLFIYLFMMAAAFMGYVLPWGQMSFWGATVITNFFTAVPIIGSDIASLIWGGFSVSNATLTRFFTLHFFLPFIIMILIISHISILHLEGSSNPLGTQTHFFLPLHPFFWIKDLSGISIYLLYFTILICFYPNTLGHSANYIPANPLITPAHIVPEWYFLPLYAILRSIPNKLGGLICMVAAIAVLFFLPIIDYHSSNSATEHRYTYKPLYWFFVSNLLLLGWVGNQPVEYPFFELGQFCTVFYFFFIFIIIPITTYLDEEKNIIKVEVMMFLYNNRRTILLSYLLLSYLCIKVGLILFVFIILMFILQDYFLITSSLLYSTYSPQVYNRRLDFKNHVILCLSSLNKLYVDRYRIIQLNIYTFIFIFMVLMVFPERHIVIACFLPTIVVECIYILDTLPKPCTGGIFGWIIFICFFIAVPVYIVYKTLRERIALSASPSWDFPNAFNLGFQDPASGISNNIFVLHHDIMYVEILLLILVIMALRYIFKRFVCRDQSFVLAHIKYSALKFGYLWDKRAEPLQSLRYAFIHNSFVELFWTSVPAYLLLLIAIPSILLLYRADMLYWGQLTIKTLANQWYWAFDWLAQY